MSDFAVQLENPNELHKTIAEVVAKLTEALERDHAFGIRPGGDFCGSADTTASVQSVLSGNDGNWEVNTGGSPDAGVPTSLLDETIAGQDVNN